MNTTNFHSLKTRNLQAPRAAIFLSMLAVVIALSLAPSRFAAAASADEAMAVVKTTVNDALEVLRNRSTPLAERQDKLRKIVAGTFDFTAMAKSALGYHWKQITPDQQTEFTDTFVAFIEDSYLSKINEFSGQQVQFLKATNDDDQYAQVNTDLVKAGSDPVHINYRLLNNGRNWKIYDVAVDSISIIANYRNQFNRVMNNQGYSTLISDLKSKQAALAASLGNH